MDIYWINSDKGWDIWIWNWIACGLFIQWIVYCCRMLQIRAQFKQSKKDGVPIILDKNKEIHTMYRYLFCIPWWANKIDNTAIDLIGKEYKKYIKRHKQDLDIEEQQQDQQTATI